MGVVALLGENTAIPADDSIAHQIVCRPSQGHRYLSREYVQPQWIYDCANARIMLPSENYLVGRKEMTARRRWQINSSSERNSLKLRNLQRAEEAWFYILASEKPSSLALKMPLPEDKRRNLLSLV